MGVRPASLEGEVPRWEIALHRQELNKKFNASRKKQGVLLQWQTHLRTLRTALSPPIKLKFWLTRW